MKKHYGKQNKTFHVTGESFILNAVNGVNELSNPPNFEELVNNEEFTKLENVNESFKYWVENYVHI